MQSSTRCFKNTTLIRNIREYHVRSIRFLDFVQFRLLDVHNFLVEMFTKLLLLILVKPFSSFILTASFFFRAYKLSRQKSDWCFVCVQNLFVKMDFSSSKTISHRKFHSVRKFFTKDGVRSKHLSCIFAKVPGRYESFGRRLHFHHFETSLLVLLKCKHPKKWKRKN